MISISMLTGPNGLLTKSTEAKIENSHGEVRERLQLETNVYLSEKLEKKYTGDLLTYLQEQGFVEEKTNKVLINKLSQGGNSIITGKGTGETDIYKLEEKTEEIGSTTKLASTEIVKISEAEKSNVKEYSINYYNESGNKKEIGLLVDNLHLGSTGTSSSPTSENMITFSIDGVEYTCKKGTTWKEWIGSENNTIHCWCTSVGCPYDSLPDWLGSLDSHAIFEDGTKQDVKINCWFDYSLLRV